MQTQQTKIPVLRTPNKHNGCISYYKLTFPRSNRAVLVEAHSILLNRITAKAENLGIPCSAKWLVTNEVVWSCHLN